MMTTEHINNYFLTKGDTTKAYLLGKEDKLFLTEEHDHIKNTFKSNKKETRMMLYRFNYFIAIIALFFLLPELFSSLGLFINNLILLFLVCLKPMVHFFSLQNKRSKMNISLYKDWCGENNFNKLAFTPDIEAEIEKGVSSLGLIIGVIREKIGK